VRMTSVPISWSQFTDAQPAFAAAVRNRFDATKHHVLATLRADGAPRVSGSEVQFYGGHLMAGMMPDSVKSADLLRDPRYAVHSNPGDGSMAEGDAKIAGVAQLLDDPAELITYFTHLGMERPPGARVFRLLVGEVVLTSLHPDGDRLVIESWHVGTGHRRRERE